MNTMKPQFKLLGYATLGAAFVLGTAGFALAQGQAPAPAGRGAGRGAQVPPAAPAPQAAKDAAPIDLTGNWVSIITEDWRWRMVTPAKGDYASIPINLEAKKVGDTWDPAKDEAAGLQCKSYAAPAIMHVPERLHITWQDDNTLKMEIDAGTQTRIFPFNPANAPGGDWQGVSAATWDRPKSRMAIGFFAPQGDWGGGLKVTTTKMKPGYLRRNGVPYSANAVLTEYYDRFDVPDGPTIMVVSAEVDDPQYMLSPFWTSTHYRKQTDATGWNPSPCSAR